MTLLVMAQPGRASTLYDNGGPNQANGLEMTVQIMADDFTLGAASVIDAVRFWDIDGGAYHGSIEWQIYTNDPILPQPVTLIASGNVVPVRTATANFVLGYAEYQNDLAIGPVALLPGRYWLGLHNGDLSFTGSSPYGDEFFWETTNNYIGNLGARSDPAPFGVGGWDGTGGEFAFLVAGTETDGVAPTPASACGGAALLAGFGGLRCLRRRSGSAVAAA
jgi:hypothetical protein